MKKLIITTVVMLMTFVGSQANAELLMLTATNGAQFNFDSSGATADSFNVGSVIQDNGLSDFALYLGYRNAGANPTFEAPIELTNGMVTAGASSNRGSIQFDPVTFGNGVQVSALATFRLSDTTGPIGDPSATLLYDLELTTTGVSGANEGSLLSLTGFDFNNNGLSDRNQPEETISGFGSSQVAIGDVNAPIERVLTGDDTFDTFQDPVVGGRTIAADNSRVDQFNGLIENNLNSLNDFSPPSSIPSNGDLGFAVFADFDQRSVDRTDVTAGVIGFRSTAASNAVIPEPSTLTMAAIGLGMVAFRRRKRA